MGESGMGVREGVVKKMEEMSTSTGGGRRMATGGLGHVTGAGG